jgi:hypothetical protein
METSNSDCLVVSPSVRETATEDGASLLDVDRGECFSINPAGARIWCFLKQGHTRAQIAAELVGTFGIDEEQASEDVADFIDNLQRHNLLNSTAITTPGRLNRLVALARKLKGPKDCRKS